MANTSEPKVDSSKSNKTIIAGIAIIIILLVVVVVLLLTRGNNTGKEVIEEPKRNVVVTEDNVEEVVNDLLEQSEETVPKEAEYYAVTMNYEWKFPTGDSPSSNAYVENNPSNGTDVYFDVFLEGNEDDKIFESPIIPVGSNISGFSLSKDLDAGTYNCICEYHLVDEEQKTLSTLRVTVKVIVEQ